MKRRQFAKPKVKLDNQIPKKVLAIKQIAGPETKKQLRGVLGLFSYFRKYVPALAAKSKILTDLTSKRAPQNLKVVWTEKHTDALKSLKRDLSESTQKPLYTVCFDRPFRIHGDASLWGAHLPK